MPSPNRLNILICNVNPSEEGFFVPLIYGMLRSFCEQSPELADSCTWLDPVMIPLPLEQFARELDLSTIDVLGISCYQWNHAYQYELARLIKDANPECTIVAGGPQVEWKDPTYFSRHPYVDFAVPAEGEIPFRDILHARLRGFESLERIEGTFINPSYGTFEYRVAQPLDLAAKPSPWLSLKEFWVKYFRRHPYYHLAASVESARGCPYGCAYCDWGSKTNLRVRQVPTDTVLAEIDFVLGTLKPWFMFWTDANLGIVPRDVLLAQRFAEAKKQSGFPLWLYYNNNKNSWTTNLGIAEAFRDAGLLTKYVLSLQHLDPEVLDAIGRTNLPEKQLRTLVRELHRIDYPIFTQLIAGCPGDTLEKWLSAFADLMEMGVHAEYRVYPFSLLPNSRAGSAEYQTEWRIEWIERPDFVAYYFLKDSSLNWALSSSRYVVSTSSYTRDDYKHMWLLAWMIQAFHDHGIIRRIAIALHHGGRIGYREFYRTLFDWFYSSESVRPFAQPAIDHITRWLDDPEASLLRRSELIEGLLEPEEDLVLRIMSNATEFFEQLGMFLRASLNVPQDLIDYQRDVLMRPESNPSLDTPITLPRRWVDYFERAEADPFGELGWPECALDLAAYDVDISDLTFPVRPWFAAPESARLRAYYDQIVQHNVPGRRRTIFKATCHAAHEEHHRQQDREPLARTAPGTTPERIRP